MMLRAMAVILGAGAAAMLAWVGYEWIYNGYGLHPLIAFPGAIIMYTLPIVLLGREAIEYEVEIEDLLEEIALRETKISFMEGIIEKYSYIVDNHVAKLRSINEK
jgi:hypothetical protein